MIRAPEVIMDYSNNLIRGPIGYNVCIFVKLDPVFKYFDPLTMNPF